MTLQEQTLHKYIHSRASDPLDTSDVCRKLARNNFFFIEGARAQPLLKTIRTDSLSDWDAFRGSWTDMPHDNHMADGGTYRRRRHATLAARASSRAWHQKPHQPHYQGRDFNSLNGGIARRYEPVAAEILNGPTMSSIVELGCQVFGALAPYFPWHIELHQFRIESDADVAGKPTPEGIHRDGVSYVIMAMVHHENMVSCESTIYDLNKNPLDSFTLDAPLDLAIVNDEQVFHGVSPVLPQAKNKSAVRDVLVATFRKQF